MNATDDVRLKSASPSPREIQGIAFVLSITNVVLCVTT